MKIQFEIFIIAKLQIPPDEIDLGSLGQTKHRFHQRITRGASDIGYGRRRPFSLGAGEQRRCQYNRCEEFHTTNLNYYKSEWTGGYSSWE
jgi:hypothetical protein